VLLADEPTAPDCNRRTVMELMFALNAGRYDAGAGHGTTAASQRA